MQSFHKFAPLLSGVRECPPSRLLVVPIQTVDLWLWPNILFYGSRLVGILVHEVPEHVLLVRPDRWWCSGHGWRNFASCHYHLLHLPGVLPVVVITVSPTFETDCLATLIWNSQTIVLQVVKPVDDQGSFLFLIARLQY